MNHRSLVLSFSLEAIVVHPCVDAGGWSDGCNEEEQSMVARLSRKPSRDTLWIDMMSNPADRRAGRGCIVRRQSLPRLVADTRAIGDSSAGDFSGPSPRRARQPRMLCRWAGSGVGVCPPPKKRRARMSLDVLGKNTCSVKSPAIGLRSVAPRHRLLGSKSARFDGKASEWCGQHRCLKGICSTPPDTKHTLSRTEPLHPPRIRASSTFALLQQVEPAAWTFVQFEALRPRPVKFRTAPFGRRARRCSGLCGQGLPSPGRRPCDDRPVVPTLVFRVVLRAEVPRSRFGRTCHDRHDPCVRRSEMPVLPCVREAQAHGCESTGLQMRHYAQPSHLQDGAHL